MFAYSDSRLIDHNILRLKKVILDTNSYPKFLPWCSGARIITQTEAGFTADLIISFKGMNIKYTSLVTVKDTMEDNDKNNKELSGRHEERKKECATERDGVKRAMPAFKKRVVYIKATMIDGPFEFLNSSWELQMVDEDKTDVKFKTEFSLKSKFLQKLMHPMLGYASNKILKSFEKYINSQLKT
ncbi:type II toxin-antitoxin system RatA family toxin [Candidatus Bandiella euplotis]|uniref:Type II toxin-antitoxin system RatA family toxin n=1 Tax=Candidatus Bandiella euplotis TaxID=1664265 RepID=A0ABZ0UMT5_9RICK|nr:type II toxin-antitoxin system RatA family toxin [Candidatus Bandiella woodruffii]WPX96571.1 Type II toxin-antitoxin system RatA family toxin [Candidatus Bandiella woodruffii]